MKIFLLPDLGEGLPDAEIVEWRVAEGDRVELDGPLVSMETAKAVVDVPSPYSGRVVRLFGQAGDVIETGQPLVEFEVADEGPEESVTAPSPETEAAEEDPATVVGRMVTSNRVQGDAVSQLGAVRVTPAVRALAHKLRVDLSAITPTGKGGVIRKSDVEAAAQAGQSPHGAETAPAQGLPTGKGDWEPVRGTRRTMARAMSQSRQQVVPVTVVDDADIHLWTGGQDIMARLVRAMVAATRAEPALNAWYDGENMLRMMHEGVNLGMAVDTPDGLFVAALRNVHQDTADGLRAKIERLREHVENRSIPPQDLSGHTIVLSNFGVFAGRYATPVVTPPCVAIVAAGKLRQEAVPVTGGFVAHRVLPLSLTFDHRACTGGEAARFLQAMIMDLSKAE
jgi:pyruvate dehydrogenase E2 component (dihydrolipoamide acetyltransferase)